MKHQSKLRAGDWVEVRNPQEIAQTLDEGGKLDGVPFMPEMLGYCGRTFRIFRLAEKTCIEFPGGSYQYQEFHNNDVVLLDGIRCSGAGHGGCQRACLCFWKIGWLKKVAGPQSARPLDESELQVLASKLHTELAPGRYMCQSTELVRATSPMSRTRILLKCYFDVRSGSRKPFEMLRLVGKALWGKATVRFPRPVLRGKLKKTPVGMLNLQPGELVRIKSPSQIAETLDENGRNRGLMIDYPLCQFSGGTYHVKSRLDRMVAETTGELRGVEGTVMLEGLHCLCGYVMGGCPRFDYVYWREAWLERVSVVDTPSVDAKSSSSSEVVRRS